jgi:hypothetical protein
MALDNKQLMHLITSIEGGERNGERYVGTLASVMRMGAKTFDPLTEEEMAQPDAVQFLINLLNELKDQVQAHAQEVTYCACGDMRLLTTGPYIIDVVNRTIHSRQGCE